jgi:hypothetical protein
VGFRKNYGGRVELEFGKVRKVAFLSVFFKLLAAIQGNGKVSCVTTLKCKQWKDMAGYSTVEEKRDTRFLRASDSSIEWLSHPCSLFRKILTDHLRHRSSLSPQTESA